MQSSSQAVDAKAEFRKPLNDAGNRKYRRRSPVNGSSSSDGSPKHDRSSSPVLSREDPAKASEHQQRRRDDEREGGRDSGRYQCGRSGNLYISSDHQSFRSSHGYSRHHDYGRHDKHANDEERNYQRLSSRTGRESRNSSHSNYERQESDSSRSKVNFSDADKSIRDRNIVTGHRSKDKEKKLSYLERQKYKDKDFSFDGAGSARRHTSSNSEETDKDRHKWDKDVRDEKRDNRRSLGDYRNDRSVTYEESRGYRNHSSSERDHGGHHLKEAYKSDLKELDGQKHAKEEKKKYDDGKTNRDKDRYYREKADFVSENQETLAKKPKFSNWDKGSDFVKDAAEKMSSSSKKVQEIGGNVAFSQANDGDSVTNELNAAKIAAMKAAELVNRNLGGGGYLSTDQKKKLLWGNKKSTTTEESGHRWDTALFGDHDRQEKFNKLMSLRLPWYIWPIVGCEGRIEGSAQTRQSRWQCSPPSREAERTAAGFGEAVHSWTSTERWTHCWIRSLSIKPGSVSTLPIRLYDNLLCSCSIILNLVFLQRQLVRELSSCHWAFQILETEKCHLNFVAFKSINGVAFIYVVGKLSSSVSSFLYHKNTTVSYMKKQQLAL
ncbi:arginine/serine-rich coiled-coil protein 2-like isoform X2 [Mangifera indica]|uniref:arginine/serine-rich coiled-coil protein 2-like isoform X2 n=1 Tax=Mangifera indica TaxID=29780 RepID=UPI001CFA7AFC|nr:arginine/serine-rich coiled-coil protein 2-like isoform X2 [Mangifera indica]